VLDDEEVEEVDKVEVEEAMTSPASEINCVMFVEAVLERKPPVYTCRLSRTVTNTAASPTPSVSAADEITSEEVLVVAGPELFTVVL
jgi:hypothetical protein